MSVIYTYVNGYGEIKTTTSGFSINQGDTNKPGMSGESIPDDPIDPQPGGEGTNSLPKPNLDGTVANATSPFTYKWSELKELAHANLSADELRDTYGIEVGDYKEVDGVKYVLVDLGCDDDGDGKRDNYAGFVFMYHSGTSSFLITDTNQGGYVSTDVGKPYVDSLYENLTDTDLKDSIKKVTITCNSGKLNADGIDDGGAAIYTTEAYMFLASTKEVGSNLLGTPYTKEGLVFDYFSVNPRTACANFATLTNITANWWLRTANYSATSRFWTVNPDGSNISDISACTYKQRIVPAFVIGYNQDGGQTGTDGTLDPENGGSNGNEPGNGNVNEPDEPIVVLPVAKSDLKDYTWGEIKALAQENLSADTLRNTYGVEVGDYKETNGVKYVLVDLGCDDDGDGKRDNYAGFVFMYDSGTSNVINDPAYSVGGYVASEMKLYVDDGDDTNNVDLYDKLDPSIKPLLKKVTIICNDGGTRPTATHEYTAHMFLASVREVGFDVSGWTKPDGYMAEGTCFDLFTTADSSRTGFMSKANISSYWWLRSANTAYDQTFWAVYTSGVSTISGSQGECVVVPAFVIG
jgi:hypothetical protein